MHLVDAWRAAIFRVDSGRGCSRRRRRGDGSDRGGDRDDRDAVGVVPGEHLLLCTGVTDGDGRRRGEMDRHVRQSAYGHSLHDRGVRRSDGGTGSDASFTRADIATGGNYTHVFSAPGTYTYYCEFHGYAEMHGTIVVRAAPVATTTSSPAPPTTSSPTASATTPTSATTPGGQFGSSPGPASTTRSSAAGNSPADRASDGGLGVPAVVSPRIRRGIRADRHGRAVGVDSTSPTDLTPGSGRRRLTALRAVPLSALLGGIPAPRAHSADGVALVSCGCRTPRRSCGRSRRTRRSGPTSAI